MKRRIVVTGLGVVTSLASKVDDLWTKVLDGQSGIHPIKLFDTSDFKIKIGGDIYDWDPSEYISHKDSKRVDRFTQLSIVAGTDAVRDAGIDFEAEKQHRCGVILGSGIGGLSEIEAQMTKLLQKGPDRVSAMTVPKMMLNAAGANLAIQFGLRGPNFSVATACASANNAIGEAIKCIRDDECDVVITGGTEAAMTRMAMSAFQNIKALSGRNDEPERASRPFDADRNGFVLSEGAGILIFEELEHARARGADIYCEVFGFGASCDAGHITQPNELGLGAAMAMQDALDHAGLAGSAVDYINAHGTSTPLGDKAETLAVKNVFGDHAYKMNLSSTKSQVGHSLGASGGIELVLTVLAVRKDIAPPTINLETPDPDCDLDYTPLVPKERTINVAMSNSFGFGGHNASILVGKFQG